jgi:hypothetical protein
MRSDCAVWSNQRLSVWKVKGKEERGAEEGADVDADVDADEPSVRAML